ncbi:hypothetical protein MGG_15499 [Pyricularia oryzae 70-15]|uniref:Uncharacterized protein n=1 Tax=Pyricularia oryzae (strain 70-15 / ATCC MYA-4617 / FGSC 8958) TaxID=242507 RepID=G4MXG5_PYRO7|nr:uncharacterized protein MGG_15499 [Pyricularia oryzae 70-15]EHA53495.1 hypothetical protein MGG_15499 [Pyricularia oryzae 70-15]
MPRAATDRGARVSRCPPQSVPGMVSIMVRGELTYGHDKYMYLPFPVLLTP